jgi:hypothetical protein
MMAASSISGSHRANNGDKHKQIDGKIQFQRLLALAKIFSQKSNYTDKKQQLEPGSSTENSESNSKGIMTINAITSRQILPCDDFVSFFCLPQQP